MRYLYQKISSIVGITVIKNFLNQLLTFSMTHPIFPRFLILLFNICISVFLFAQQNRISVDAGTVMNSIAPTLFGSCMEDVNHEIYGGLYDQKIMGESFEEPASGTNYNNWKKMWRLLVCQHGVCINTTSVIKSEFNKGYYKCN